MTRFNELYPRILPYILTAITFGAYWVIFANYSNQLGTGIASLATIPVIIASWYFGIGGGLLFAGMSIATSVFLLSVAGHTPNILLSDPGNLLRMVALTLVAIVTGRLSTITRERTEVILKLEQYEKERRAHTNFLEVLHGITTRALEAENLQSTRELLTKQIAELFQADDAFFSFWDLEKEIPIPTVAYGSMSGVDPNILFDLGEQTLTASVMKVEQPISVADIENSVYLSPNNAALFPSRSMLGLPLIAQQRKLGALILGYTTIRQFDDNDILHAKIAAEQVALVLSKSHLLDEERKQVRQLGALHDAAMTSIEADNEDQLIERITEIIAQNLFPDNVGIMLLDRRDGILRAHPSYHFYATEEIKLRNIHIGEGITGEVAKSGQPQRIGNVRLTPQYTDVDYRTVSELCVPIKFKERILGIINVESGKRNAFTVDDERLLVTLAGQLATAIEQLRKSQAERKWFDQLAHSNELIYAIAQITTQIGRALTIDDIIQTLGNELRKIDLTCIVAVYDADQAVFTIKYTSLESRLRETLEKELGYPLIGYTFSQKNLDSILNTKDVLHRAAMIDPGDEIQALFTNTSNPGVQAILQKIGDSSETVPLRLPLVFEENLLGILWAWGKDIRKSDLSIMSIFAKQIGASLERARLFQEVQSLALTDWLTGLHNRRSLFELGRIEFSRAHRMNRSFCCMMLDLDHFKQINDNYGHQVGDQVLQEFAARCRNSVREEDLIGRYGGEELIILMPETDLKTAQQVAERLRQFVAKTPMVVSSLQITATVSIGLAQKDENTLHLETLIARADQAMYIAKHKGRNQVATSK